MKVVSFLLSVALLSIPLSARSLALEDDGGCFRCNEYEDPHQGELYHHDFHIGVKGRKVQGGEMHMGTGTYGSCRDAGHNSYDGSGGGQA